MNAPEHLRLSKLYLNLARRTFEDWLRAKASKRVQRRLRSRWRNWMDLSKFHERAAQKREQAQ